MLIDVEATEGYWTGIFAKNTGFKDQAYTIVEDWEDVSAVIKKRWKDGYRLVNIEYTATEWFLIFVVYPKEREELFANNEDIEDFQVTIQKNRKKGFYLIDLTNGRD